MYCHYFGFTEKPFDITPDPRFLYLNPSHQKILTTILDGIEDRRGFILLIGDAGTGKTTLLNAVMERLPPTTKAAFIFNTNLTFKQMLLMALVDLGIIQPQRNVSGSEAILYLNRFAVARLAAGGNVVLIVDEAQNLKQNSLESLRLLSNLETPKHKLVQIVLCGQPQLDVKLSRPKLKQLSQRINLRHYARSFNESETCAYISHRLMIAKYKGDALFNAGSLKLIWEYSRGIPRKINMLCDKALLIAYARDHKHIAERFVKEAISDLSYRPFDTPSDDTLKKIREMDALL